MLLVRPFDNPTNECCDSPVCDGRPARWTIGTAQIATTIMFRDQPRACSVHLARICEIVVDLDDVRSPAFREAYRIALEASAVKRESAGRRKKA